MQTPTQQSDAGRLDVAVVVLTRDEERNIVRAVGSVVDRARQVFVVDSGSTDQTIPLAKVAGAEVFENPWPGYAAQRNWALDNLPIRSAWVFFLDADEFVDDGFWAEFSGLLARADDGVAGFSIRRWLEWGGARVAYGGMQDTRILRVVRFGRGRCDDRVVNEHLVVDGEEVAIETPVGHRNESGLARWIEKHRVYARLEAEALLEELVTASDAKGDLAEKRLKMRRFYAALPPFARSFARFGYTMTVKEGWRDGLAGGGYHLLHDLVFMLAIDAHFVRAAAQKAAKKAVQRASGDRS